MMSWFELFKAPTRIEDKTTCEHCGQQLPESTPVYRKTKVFELKFEILEAIEALSEQGEATSGGVKDWINENSIHTVSASRLSQAITELVNQGMVARRRPVPYRKGVVVLERVKQ